MWDFTPTLAYPRGTRIISCAKLWGMTRSIAAMVCGGVAWLISRYVLGWDSDSAGLVFLASVVGLMLARLDRLEAAHEKRKAAEEPMKEKAR